MARRPSAPASTPVQPHGRHQGQQHVKQPAHNLLPYKAAAHQQPQQQQQEQLQPASEAQLEGLASELKIKHAFEVRADRHGRITAHQLRQLLRGFRLEASPEQLQGYVSAIAAHEAWLTLPETLAVCAAASTAQQRATEDLQLNSPRLSPRSLLQGSPSQGAVSMGGSLRALSQRRSYMDSGWLVGDQAVLAYMKKLEQHRKRCEREGRYLEARAASLRLAELKAKEAERMRQAIHQRQESEVALAEAAFQKEKTKLQALWQQRTEEYNAAVDVQVQKLAQKHAAQRQALQYSLESRRPARPKYSKDLLNQRRVVEVLARQGQYSKAAAVQDAANGMEAAEMRATLAVWEAEAGLKESKLLARQAQELEVLQARGDRGQDELRRAHQQDLERREQRLRNLKAELVNLQRLEVVHLENFLDGQARAGKQRPMQRATFRREGQVDYDLTGI